MVESVDTLGVIGLLAILTYGCGDRGGPATGPAVSVPYQTSQLVAGDRVAAMHNILTQDSWSRRLEPQESCTYRFLANGEYEKTIKSDVIAPKEIGTWKLVQDEKGQVHLVLMGKQLYWLGQDSIIEYDAETDKALVSGPGYVGRQPLDRHKALHE